MCECGCVSKHQKEGQHLLGRENSENQACVFQKWGGGGGKATPSVRLKWPQFTVGVGMMSGFSCLCSYLYFVKFLQ